MEPEQLDKRYDEIATEYPKGLTPDQFCRITLESAGEDGRIYPHPVEFFAHHSMLLNMFMNGLIQSRPGGPNKPFNWHITDKGIAYLKTETATP